MTITPRPWYCEICGAEYDRVTAGKPRRCDGAECQEFVRQNRRLSTKSLARKWKQQQAVTGKCPSGKVRHGTKKDALQAMQTIVRYRYPAQPDWLSVYQCPIKECYNGWHLTSRPQVPTPPGKQGNST